MASKFGNTKGGNALGIDAMSPTVSTSTCRTHDARRHHDERDQRRERLERLDEVEHRPHHDRRHRDQTRRRAARSRCGEGVDELADGVVAAAVCTPVASTITPAMICTAMPVVKPVITALETKFMMAPNFSSPNSSITTPTTRASAATFAGSAGVEAGRGQHAARRQGQRAGQRRHHQHGAGEHRAERSSTPCPSTGPRRD